MFLHFTIAVYHPLELFVEDNVKQLVRTTFGNVVDWKVLRTDQEPDAKPKIREPTLKIFCKTSIQENRNLPVPNIYLRKIIKWTQNIQFYSPSAQRPWLGIQRNDAYSRTNKVCHERLNVSEVAFGTLTSCSEFQQQRCLSNQLFSSILGTFYHDTKYFEIKFQAKYLISVKYVNIRQIIIHEDENRTNLFFHLLCPPLCYEFGRYEFDLDGPTKKMRASAIAGVTPDQIGRSNVLKISFSKTMAVQEVISRLYFRCGMMPVMYTYVNVKDAPMNQSIPNIDLSYFDCTYMFNSILRRSFMVQLQHPGHQMDVLVTLLANLAAKRHHLLYLALVDVMYLIDDFAFVDFQNAVTTLFDWFEKNEELAINKDSHYIIPEKSRNIWRITLTPTRQLLWPAELMFENRILRKYDSNYSCRVAFRDDNNSKLYATYQKDSIFQNAIRTPMLNGLTVGPMNFEFLGWSNSQIRDHGVWMYSKDQQGNTAESIRRWMGDFSAIRSVSLFMARMGQCYSKSEEAVKIPLSGKNVVTEPDITGGLNPEDGKPYCFSDGVGKISVKLWKQVISTIGLETEPSALQIRYAGCKGMLVVDPQMSDNVDIIFRKSMDKFACTQSQALEVVKYSTPMAVYLNRQVITILGQLGVSPGVFLKLQEEMLIKLTDMLVEKSPAVEYLSSHCPLVGMDYKDLAASGFELTLEPFFRSMLLGLHRKAVDGVKTKARLEIDPAFGRNMFGVLDETATLQYGQVFVKYSVDLTKPNLPAKVLTGRVLVTKNPCLQFGDVRMLDAVDIPALHHIVDNVVFPQTGARPHPNEMAGSDLDGDEYTVIWYRPLLFEKNKPASDFPIPVKTELFRPIMVPDMIDCLCNIIRNDKVGILGNAHLVKADWMGLDNSICHKLARKYSIAVDFVKHGQSVSIDKTERAIRYPDFMDKGGEKDTYRSKNTLGKLYRVCKVFEADNRPYGLELKSIKVDPDLELPGWEKYRPQAEQALLRYNRLLEIVLLTYGVLNETEVMAKAVLSIHLRLQEKQDRADAEEMAIRAVQALWKNMKKEFMDEFISDMESSDPDTQIKFQTSVEEINYNIYLKASAWYMVTYSDPNPKYISFPWIMANKLAWIKATKRAGQGTPAPPTTTSVKSLEKMLVNSIDFKQVPDLSEEIRNVFSNNSSHLMGETLTLAVRVLICWAKRQGIARDSPDAKNVSYNNFKRMHIPDLVRAFLKVIEDMPSDALALEMLFKFFRTCISLRFSTKAEVRNKFPIMLSSYRLLGKKSMFTYHTIAVSANLVALGLYSENHFEDEEEHEMEVPRRLPDNVAKANTKDNFQRLTERLMRVSKAREIIFRELSTNYVLLSAIGKPSAIRIINEIADKEYRFE